MFRRNETPKFIQWPSIIERWPESSWRLQVSIPVKKDALESAQAIKTDHNNLGINNLFADLRMQVV